jgi:hypothetical protein
VPARLALVDVADVVDVEALAVAGPVAVAAAAVDLPADQAGLVVGWEEEVAGVSAEVAAYRAVGPFLHRQL